MEDPGEDPPRPTATIRTAKKFFDLPFYPATSPDPREWREQPRKTFRTPWNPRRRPGNLNAKSDEGIGMVFLKMMTDPLQLLLEETNRHGASRKLTRKWKDVDKSDVLTHIALTLGMGAMPKHDLSDYWLDKGLISTPKFKEAMPLARYKQIIQNLHFENEEVAKQRGWDVRGGPHRDSIYKIRRLWKLTFQGFRNMRAPRRQNVIDEQIIGFLGQFAHRQHIPSKPEPTGIKVYAGAESRAGYVHSGHIHCEEKFPLHDEGVILSRVMALMEEAEILDQGYELFTGNNNLILQQTLFWAFSYAFHPPYIPPYICCKFKL